MSGKCNAFLLADRVIREENGKVGIIGSFNTFNFPVFPTVAPPFFAYVNLEDFSGEQEFSVNIVKEGADFVVGSHGGEIKFADPSGEAELAIPFVGVRFPKAGIYNVLLTVNSYQYGSRKLIVNQTPTTQQGGS